MVKILSTGRTNTKGHLSGRDALILAHPLALDQSPAAVYLAQLKHSSRRPQKQALDLVASLLTGGNGDCLTLNWGAARYQHTAAVRGRLLDGYAPATANRILSALRGVLEQTWLLGQMSAEDYHRAARLSPVIGETLPAGRELSADEVTALLQDCKEDPRVDWHARCSHHCDDAWHGTTPRRGHYLESQ